MIGHAINVVDDELSPAPHLAAEAYAARMVKSGDLEAGDTATIAVWDGGRVLGIFQASLDNPSVERIA